MSATRMRRVLVLYSRNDEDAYQSLRERLDATRVVDEIQGTVGSPDPRLIENWVSAHTSNLEALGWAEYVCLVLSADFLGAPGFNVIETEVINRQREGRCHVALIHLKACDVEKTALSGLLLLPRCLPVVPLVDWKDVEQAWADVEDGLRGFLRDLPDPGHFQAARPA